MDPSTLVGVTVEVHGLTSTAGQALNGRRGTVEGYDPDSERLIVVIASASAGRPRAHALRVRNVRRLPYVHFGRGCDGCGMYPIEGTCMKCLDCSESIGFDLCGACYQKGVHARESAAGRFNQAHRPEHRMEEVPQEMTVLHQLQHTHPELTIEQILALVQRADDAQQQQQQQQQQLPLQQEQDEEREDQEDDVEAISQ